MSLLHSLGWNDTLEAERDAHASTLTPHRVVAVDRDSFLVANDARGAHQRVSLAGRLHHAGQGDIAVGDWVGVHGSRIDHVFTRRSALVRKRVGASSEHQLIAANVDWVFIATSLNDDFSPRRVERFAVAAWDAGAIPVVLLTKSDLSDDSESVMQALSDVAGGCELISVSALDGTGIDAVRQRIGAGQTAVLLGSSGVGKSTLINALVGRDTQLTAEVRETDAKGRHTTTRREMLLIPETGGLIIDTPGVREFGVTSGEEAEGLEHGFADVEALASDCRFGDCGHETEPGCMVQRAIEEGQLSRDRLESYFRLERELAYNASRNNTAQRRREGKKLSALIREHTKRSRK